MLVNSALVPLALVTACGRNNLASRMARSPEMDAQGQARCGVMKSSARPLIIEWPSSDRATLEGMVKSDRGLIAVRYEGCEMEVVRRCKVAGRYSYTAVEPKRDDQTFSNTTELYAGLTWKMLGVKYSYAVSDTFGFPDSDGSYYVEGNLNWDVVDKVNDYIGKITLIGHVGYQSYKSWGAYSYTDWKAGVATDVMGLTVGLVVTGTDAESALYTNRFGKDISDTQVVGYIQKTF